MKIYNTLTTKKEEFMPANPPNVGMYACGVTVYDYCHIGHARSAIVFDVIRRYLKYKGYDVTYVRNFTDIDDKIIKRSQEEGLAWNEVAKKYTEEYYRDMEELGVEKADIEPKATEYIAEMIDIVRRLIDRGYAYDADGDVYFAVGKFPDYGKLSKRQIDDMLAGARIEVDEKKRNPLDFALWKKSKEGEPFWESPWGAGRPGWHIECSAMSIRHLGESFDIHGGGADLLFPHHENEIAQSEALTGRPFARYWIHNGFITINKEKMSKSLGNFFTIREVLRAFDPEVVRFFLLSTHYRSPIEFSDEQLREIEASIDRCYTAIIRLHDVLETEPRKAGLTKPGERFQETLREFRGKFEEAMDDDFNTALALGHFFELIRETNKFLDSRPSTKQEMDLLHEVRKLIIEISNVMNVLRKSPHDWYVSLMRVKGIGLSETEIQEKIAERREARQKKDWGRADEIRNELAEKGVILEDKKERTDWKIRI